MKNLNRLIILTFFLFPFSISAQILHEPFICGTDMSDEHEPRQTDYAPNGTIHTMKGGLKVLMVFVAFKPQLHQPYGEWVDIPEGLEPNNFNNYGHPSWVQQVGNTNTYTTHDFLFNDSTDFEEAGPIDDPNNLSISKSLYEMSNGEFKLTGGYFKDSLGAPALVVLDLPTGTSDWKDVFELAVDKMMEINPNFDFGAEGYDQRENTLKADFFNVNNSSSSGDGVVDFIVFINKYNLYNIVPGMSDWNGSQGGIAYINSSDDESFTDVAAGELYNGYNLKYNASVGLMTASNVDIVGRTFLHEFAHSLMKRNHDMGANGDRGIWLSHQVAGWGTMGTNRSIFHPMLNSWERWFNGYIEPELVTPDTNAVEYWVRDYITTGDALRIRIPFSINSESSGQRQYLLWIENHTGKSAFDENSIEGQQTPVNGVLYPGADHGIYMFVENQTESLGIVSDKVNGIRVLNAAGNRNYYFDIDDRETTINGGKYDYFHRSYHNPLRGINPWLHSKFIKI